ncbi:DUF1361 domain-containing protein [Flavobacteriaceae bacterium 3-367]
MKTIKYVLKRPEMPLALSLCFGLALLLFRILLTHSLFYVFLGWNLFLAGIPYLITRWIQGRNAGQNSHIRFYMAFSAWLLFLPNSPYIITDLVHLHNESSSLVWYDLFLVFVFAVNGLILGLLSMLDMHRFLVRRYSTKMAHYLMFFVCLLSGYGIYLGRFLRFNSWDLFTRPLRLLREMVQTLPDPKVWLMTFAFGGFLWILFLVVQMRLYAVAATPRNKKAAP